VARRRHLSPLDFRVFGDRQRVLHGLGLYAAFALDLIPVRPLNAVQPVGHLVFL
jgi:hypothetical protein